jgi:hypothetical protein
MADILFILAGLGFSLAPAARLVWKGKLFSGVLLALWDAWVVRSITTSCRWKSVAARRAAGLL